MRIQKQIYTIVYIGAGRCSEYEEYKASGAKRIVLIEADPESARYLREILTEEENTEIIERAVTASGEHRALQLYNVRRYSSLREATGLRELYPGLRKIGEVYPETWSPRQMCEEIGIDQSKFNWLIVDAPGEEGSILENLKEEELLEQFEKVSFSAGVTPHYKENITADKILSELEAAGYEELSKEDDSEPERPRWKLYRDEVKLRNKELEYRLSELTQELVDYKGEKERILNEIKNERESKKSIEIENKKISNDFNKIKAELGEYKNNIYLIRNELEEKNKLVDEYKENQNNIEKLKGTIEKKNNEISELRARLHASHEEIFKAEGQLDVMKNLLLGEKNI